jgi:tetratricopeptide (TPR) repeat protein
VISIFRKNILLQPQNELGMAKKKASDAKGDQRLENIEGTLTKTEQFIIGNQKTISIVVGIIVVIILGFFGYQRYIVQPKTKEAQNQMYVAQRFFEADSIDKALYGDGNSLGFVDLADEYGNTKPGNLANYYAGICFLKKGNYQQAIDYLKNFSDESKMVGPMATGAIGDAYLELGDKEKAAAYYLQAANQDNNEMTSPLFLYKAGEVNELLGDYNAAIDVYNRIKKDFPKSTVARTIDKNIGRATILRDKK